MGRWSSGVTLVDFKVQESRTPSQVPPPLRVCTATDPVRLVGDCDVSLSLDGSVVGVFIVLAFYMETLGHLACMVFFTWWEAMEDS